MMLLPLSRSAILRGLLALGLHAASHAGEYEVSGSKFEVALSPEKPSVMFGEPMHVSFTVRNHSERPLHVLDGGDYKNAFGRPDSFKISVTSEDGKTLPMLDARYNMGGLIFPRPVPAGGSYIFPLTLSHWARIEKPGSYHVTVSRILKFATPSGKPWSTWGKKNDVEVQASTTLTVTPPDSRKLGEIITSLGKQMLDGLPRERGPAATELALISDERVVPFFARAVETGDYDTKFAALIELGKYRSAEAFHALQAGMKIRGRNVPNSSTPELAEKVADNLRNGAAISLSKSPWPDALPYLLVQRNDSSAGVRMTVLHALGRMNAAEAVPILKEMSDDMDETIREEAKRYLRRFGVEK